MNDSKEIRDAKNVLFIMKDELHFANLENARLKAEVERLNTGIQPEGSNDAVGRAVNVLLEKEKEIARLKAEVEHLQSENLLVREEADLENGIEPEIVHAYAIANVGRVVKEPLRHWRPACAIGFRLRGLQA